MNISIEGGVFRLFDLTGSHNEPCRNSYRSWRWEVLTAWVKTFTLQANENFRVHLQKYFEIICWNYQERTGHLAKKKWSDFWNVRKINIILIQKMIFFSSSDECDWAICIRESAYFCWIYSIISLLSWIIFKNVYYDHHSILIVCETMDLISLSK